MKRTFIILFALAISAATMSTAKGAPAVRDSEFDNRGDMCRPDGPCTFTRREILPGNIPAEAQVVSLGAFRPDVEGIFNYAFGDVRRVASLLDDNTPGSEVSKVNDNAGSGFVQVGPEFIQLLGAAKKAFLWTGGAFDITTTPEIGNFTHIKVSGNMVYLKKKGMRISFRNILPGYIADLLIRAIYNSNIDNAIAEVGQAKRSIGMSVAGKWRTEVLDSEGGTARRGMTIDISNISVASVIRGENAPTTDPRGGKQLNPGYRSVTIISRNAAIAEGLAYGIYVLGPEKGMETINRLQTVKGIMVDANGNFIKTPGL